MSNKPKKQKSKTETSVTDLLDNLSNPDFKVRRNAVRDLGKSGDQKAVEPAILALQDKTINVRSRAATALGRLGNPLAVNPLLKALNDKSCKVERAAYNSLIQLDLAAVESLCQALKDDDENIRYQAVTILANIGSKRATQPLIEILSDKVDRVRTQVIIALGWIKDTGAVEPLLRILKDPSEQEKFRLTTLLSLGEIADPSAMEALLEELNNPSYEIRRATVMALGNFKDNKVVGVLMETFQQDPDAQVRNLSADAMGKIGDETVIPILIAAIKETEKYNQETIIAALLLISNLEIEKVNNWLEQTGIYPSTYSNLIALLVNAFKSQQQAKAISKRTRWLY